MNPRDIGSHRLDRLRKLTNHPELLDELVSTARQHLGFFTKHATRSLEYPWVMATLLRERIGTAIDIGAGVSPVPLLLARRGIKVQTVDYSSRIRSMSTKEVWTEWGFLDYSVIDPRIESYNASFSEAPLKGPVDACYSISVIEHMPAKTRRKMIARAAELIRLGGFLVLTVDLVQGSDRLWNLDRGSRVEEPETHGSLYNLLLECQQEGFKTCELQIVKDIPNSRVDMLFCTFRRAGITVSDSESTIGVTRPPT